MHYMSKIRETHRGNLGFVVYFSPRKRERWTLLSVKRPFAALSIPLSHYLIVFCFSKDGLGQKGLASQDHVNPSMSSLPIQLWVVPENALAVWHPPLTLQILFQPTLIFDTLVERPKQFRELLLPRLHLFREGELSAI